MAIPASPNNFNAQQANRQAYVSWDATIGATSYDVQRSLDGATYVSIATPAIAEYLDTSVTVGVFYWYKVASVNSDGTSTYTAAQKVVPAPTAEMSLYELRTRSQQRADREHSDFVSLSEWNFFIDQAMYELYDLLITSYEDYFKAPNAIFNTVGNQFIYPLPDGLLSYTDDAGNALIAKPFYKLLGVDLAINATTNAWVTVKKYNMINRNDFTFTNTASTIYGLWNLRYRVMGANIEFIPIPSSNQMIRLQYVPRLPALLKDTDLTNIGYSGWLQYVIVRAAKYALDKEESDTTKLDQELVFLKQRIEAAAQGRDEGQADTISDTRSDPWGSSGGWSGFKGGW